MSALLIRFFALIAIFVSVFLISQLLLATTINRRAKNRAVNKRLQLLRAGIDRDVIVSILRRTFPTKVDENAGPIERMYFKLEQMIRVSGLSVEPRNFVLYMLMGFALLEAFLIFLAWSFGYHVTSGLVELTCGVSAAISIGLPIIVVSRMAQRRRKKMQDQFPLALDVFTRALRAGHPIAAAIELVTEETEDPLGSEFGLVSDEVAYGAELNDALLNLADRWDLEDIRMFVISLAIQSETGGNLAEILENLTTVIRARASLYLKVRALSSEGRMSGWMLTALPILTLISMFLVSPRFYFDVAQDPIFIYGFTFLVIWYFIGVLIIRRMIDLKV